MIIRTVAANQSVTLHRFKVENQTGNEVKGAHEKEGGSTGGCTPFVVVTKIFKFGSKAMLYGMVGLSFPYVQDYFFMIEDYILCCLKYVKCNMQPILVFKTKMLQGACYNLYLLCKVYRPFSPGEESYLNVILLFMTL